MNNFYLDIRETIAEIDLQTFIHQEYGAILLIVLFFVCCLIAVLIVGLSVTTTDKHACRHKNPDDEVTEGTNLLEINNED